MSVPLRRALEGPSLPTSFKEAKETNDCSPMPILDYENLTMKDGSGGRRKSLSFPDLSSMDAALANEISEQRFIPTPPTPPPLPGTFELPAPTKMVPEKMDYDQLKEPKPKPSVLTKPQLNVALSELHFAKQNLKKVTMGEGGRRGPLYLKAQLPSAYVTPMVNTGRRMSDSAVKTESLLKRMHKNLSQDIPIANFASTNHCDHLHRRFFFSGNLIVANFSCKYKKHGSVKPRQASDFNFDNFYANADEDVEYADAFDIQAMKINEPWFFGNADRNSEEKLIWRIGLDGTFLVRRSRGRNEYQPFTLTVLFEKNLFRLKIRYLPTGDYALGEKKDEEIKFPSVQALVSHYQKIPLILIGVGGGRTLLKHIPSCF